MPTLPLGIDSERVVRELWSLAEISDCPDPPPAVTRVVFTETDRRARALLGGWLRDAGLEVRVDPIGNTFARWEGSDPGLAAILTGSHIDAIPHSGMYDGTVGVLGGLEAIRALRRAGIRPRRSIELVVFTSEEPTRFAVGCTGSRALAGLLDPLALRGLRDEAGDDYDVVRTRAGYQGGLETIALGPDRYSAFVELHIEQGPELESTGVDIGVVTAIAAPATYVITVEGEGGHAGAVLMPKRHDALCAAADMVTMVESIAKSSPSPDLVATVGQLQVHPGAINSIPNRVRMTLDIRDIDGAIRDAVVTRIEQSIAEISRLRGVKTTVDCLHADPPATCDPGIVDAIEEACEAAGKSSTRMISRAYHDALFMARLAPVSMIFIPCRGGISHRPDEFSTPDQIAAGIEVLARVLACQSMAD